MKQKIAKYINAHLWSWQGDRKADEVINELNELFLEGVERPYAELERELVDAVESFRAALYKCNEADSNNNWNAYLKTQSRVLEVAMKLSTELARPNAKTPQRSPSARP